MLSHSCDILPSLENQKLKPITDIGVNSSEKSKKQIFKYNLPGKLSKSRLGRG